MGWLIPAFLLGVIVGIWLHMAFISWRQERLGFLKRSAKREHRHLRRK